jgi:hypothetical protein
VINVGIIISVSDYGSTSRNLPACERDGLAMTQILKTSGRFNDLLHIDGEITGASAKSKIAEFINKHSGEEIGDFLFYFTGHGEFHGDEFYYLMSDYASARRKQSSLENTELDNMVRSLAPNTFVKIVDACHSGIPYIKDTNGLESYLKSSGQSSFKSIYFLFSSQSDEYSYQDDKLSFFTNSIISAIYTHANGPVRYKNVIDYVSDDFAQNNAQTPLFVSQAKFTEIFLNVTDELKGVMSPFVSSRDNEGDKSSDQKTSLSLVEALQKDALNFCTKDEAHTIIRNFFIIAEQIEYSKEIAGLYEAEAEPEFAEYPPQPASIGSWLEKNNENREFFAKPSYDNRQVVKRVPKNALLASITGMSDPNSYINVTENEKVLVGYVSSAEVPHIFITIHLTPKYRNLAPEECYIAHVVSRSHVRFFWAYSHFEYTDWELSRRVGKLEWLTEQALLRDEASIRRIFNLIASRFCTFVEELLRSRWGDNLNITESG